MRCADIRCLAVGSVIAARRCRRYTIGMNETRSARFPACTEPWAMSHCAPGPVRAVSDRCIVRDTVPCGGLRLRIGITHERWDAWPLEWRQGASRWACRTSVAGFPPETGSRVPTPFRSAGEAGNVRPRAFSPEA